jgi:DNA invertase Pin-like site-specific DNA recombinase
VGRFYGYNRVSSKEQNLERGRKSIQDFCRENGYPLEKIYEDKQTGKDYFRPRYIVLKEDVLRSGDTLVIPEYDRLGRADQTKKELEYFKEKGVRIIFLDIPTTKIDISSFNDAMAQMILAFINDMLISFYDLIARTELERKQKRQREGIEAMKAKGEWSRYGRPRCMSKEEFAKQYEQVLIGVIGTLELQRKLGLNKDTFFRYVREYKKERAL